MKHLLCVSSMSTRESGTEDKSTCRYWSAGESWDPRPSITRDVSAYSGLPQSNGAGEKDVWGSWPWERGGVVSRHTSWKKWKPNSVLKEGAELIRQREVSYCHLHRAGRQPGLGELTCLDRRSEACKGSQREAEDRERPCKPHWKFGFYPKGNQMQLRAFKRGCGRIRFAFCKDSLGSSRKQGSERGTGRSWIREVNSKTLSETQVRNCESVNWDGVPYSKVWRK